MTNEITFQKYLFRVKLRANCCNFVAASVLYNLIWKLAKLFNVISSNFLNSYKFSWKRSANRKKSYGGSTKKTLTTVVNVDNRSTSPNANITAGIAVRSTAAIACRKR